MPEQKQQQKSISAVIQDKSGKCLTEEQEILSRWTEHCSELYNHVSCGDNAVLGCSQSQEEDLQPILHGEVEIAVALLKKGQSVETKTELRARLGRPQTMLKPPVNVLLAVPRRLFFCFGTVVLDVMCSYVLLFLLDIKI